MLRRCFAGFILGFTLLGFHPFLKAQDPSGLSGTVHYGFVMAHRTSMSHLNTGHVNAMELSWFRQSLGNKEWEQSYLYPEVGFKLYVANLGNPSLLGVAIAPIPYIYFPFVHGKRFSFGIDLGTSYGYITKRFNTEENHKSIAIGSHVNGVMHGNLQLKYLLNSGLQLKAGIALTHFSNGAFKMPNLGINVPTLTLGFAYLPERKDLIFKEDKLPTVLKKIEYSVSIAAGIKELYIYGSKKYPTFTASLYAMKPLNRKSKLGLSANVFYNTAIAYELRDSLGNKADAGKITRIGIGIPYELDVNRLSIVFQIGFYVLDQFKKDGTMYERIGVHYDLSDRIFFTHILKIHFGKADNIEFGLGFRL